MTQWDYLFAPSRLSAPGHDEVAHGSGDKSGAQHGGPGPHHLREVRCVGPRRPWGGGRKELIYQ